MIRHGSVELHGYLTDRKLRYDTDNGPAEYIVPSDVLQVSVLRQLLWNIMCNDILNIPAPSEASLADYADDIAMTVFAKHLAGMEI